MRFRTIVPCLATALVFVAGCGSSKKSTSSASTPAAPPATNTATTATTKTTTTPAKKHKAAAVPSRTYHVKLSGAVESPPGAPKGSGSAVITLHGKSHQVCWTFTAVPQSSGIRLIRR